MSRVLVVDDDADIRELVTFKLQQTGYTVEAAPDGQLGLDAALANTPDLILLDLMMPEMDGFEFIAELRRREEWRSIPVVVITAKDLTAEDHQRLNGYVAAIVQKSAYSREELLAELRDLLATSVLRPATGRAT
jgi:CheY-like chemotaxis protein